MQDNDNNSLGNYSSNDQTSEL